jgi:hypothetical protein
MFAGEEIKSMLMHSGVKDSMRDLIEDRWQHPDSIRLLLKGMYLSDKGFGERYSSGIFLYR